MPFTKAVILSLLAAATPVIATPLDLDSPIAIARTTTSETTPCTCLVNTRGLICGYRAYQTESVDIKGGLAGNCDAQELYYCNTTNGTPAGSAKRKMQCPDIDGFVECKEGGAIPGSQLGISFDFFVDVCA